MKVLRPYQLDAFKYAQRRDHPAIFMDMRLGKTLATIRRIKRYTPKDDKLGLQVLVVAPNSALGSWEDELVDQGERFAFVKGNRPQRLEILKNKTSGVNWFLINKEGFLAVPEIGSASRCKTCKRTRTKTRCPTCRGKSYIESDPIRQWDAVVLDESIFIKNPAAQVTKFFLKVFKQVPHRWILTGLPNPEGLLDYVCQLLFLDGEFFGCKNFYEYRTRNFRPMWDHSFMPLTGVECKLNSFIGKRCFILKRKDVGMEAEKIRETRWVEMPKPIRKVYNEAESDYVLRMPSARIDKSTVWKPVQYMWLRLLCGGFADGQEVWGGKLAELGYLLSGELLNEQVVVWFSFNHEIASAAHDLKIRFISHAVITGVVKVEERRNIIKRFNQGKVRVLLVQQAVAQVGLDLSAADTSIYFSEPLGLSAARQTEDRILRVGKKTPLLYIYLTVRDSIDEDIRKAMRMKSLLSNKSLFEAAANNLLRRYGK